MVSEKNPDCNSYQDGTVTVVRAVISASVILILFIKNGFFAELRYGLRLL